MVASNCIQASLANSRTREAFIPEAPTAVHNSSGGAEHSFGFFFFRHSLSLISTVLVTPGKNTKQCYTFILKSIQPGLGGGYVERHCEDK